MTDDELWQPGVDPNAETQRAWPAEPGASIPRQGSSREADEPLAETMLAVPGRFPVADGSREGAGPGRRPSRRRLLFAAGGVMLLAGAGAATAAAMDGGGHGGPQASGGPGRSAGAGSSSGSRGSGSPSGGATGASGAGSSSASASDSASSSASPSGSGSGSPSGSPNVPGKVATAPQWYVDDQGPMAIALTMDDGPSSEYTPQVLQVLQQYGIKATFNMIGSQVHSNLPLVREVSAAGHTITNHTWNHADLSKLTVAEVLSQIDRCNDALADANQNPTIFRAPYGNWSTAVYQACAARNLRPVGWSVDPRDWDTAHVSVAAIVQNVMAHTHAHDIILEHDGPSDRAHTVAALKIFIPQLLEKGFNFVAM